MVLQNSYEEGCGSRKEAVPLCETNGTLTAFTSSAPSLMDSLEKPFKVVIVGAGASGLQCCYSLVHQYQMSLEDILILEARSRVGGRIYTTFETAVTKTILNCNGNATEQNGYAKEPTTTFALDHGAAWVHGTGFDSCMSGNDIARVLQQSSVQLLVNDGDVDSLDGATIINPVMHLLQLEADTRRHMKMDRSVENDIVERVDADVYDDLQIKPLVNGNPWMRPRSALHNQGQLGLFVAGQYIDNSSDQHRQIIDESLRRHYSILREVHSIGDEMYDSGQGMETTTTSVADVIRKVLETRPELFQCHPHGESPQDDQLVRQQIAAIAPFYMLLLECWYGCDVSTLQLCEFVEDEQRIQNHEDDQYKPQGDFLGPHCTLQNGMFSVLQPLLRNGVQERILLEQEVTQIGYSHLPDTTLAEDDVPSQNRFVTVETSSGLRLHADACVVTIPAGCLKDAVFTDPPLFSAPLSESKVEAISFLKMGTYKKVFLTFDHIFWPTQPPFLGLIRHLTSSDDAATEAGSNGRSSESYYATRSNHSLGNCLLVDNLWALRGVPSFEVVLFGLAGLWSTDKSEDEICSALLDFISDAMSMDRALLQKFYVSCHITRWEEDKFSRGAYSYMALGALERHTEELRRSEWDGRLVFAGEATISEYEGSVYSALYSGMNAAKSVHEIFQSPS